MKIKKHGELLEVADEVVASPEDVAILASVLNEVVLFAEDCDVGFHGAHHWRVVCDDTVYLTATQAARLMSFLEALRREKVES